MKLEDWNTLLQFVSAVLLGLTFAVGAGAIWTGYVLSKRQDERIARISRDVAEANARAAEANRVAEEEKLARLKIEERLAWRVLTSEQEARIASKLSAFKGNPVTVGTSPATVEAGRFAKQLQEVLARAGWKSYMTSGPIDDMVASGVVVRTTTDPRGVKAGMAVVEALRSEHFEASFSEDLPGVGTPTIDPKDPYLARALVVVGSKP